MIKVNKFYKLIFLMVCISFTLLLVGSIFASFPAQAASNPVKLYSAKINTFHEKMFQYGIMPKVLCLSKLELTKASLTVRLAFNLSLTILITIFF